MGGINNKYIYKMTEETKQTIGRIIIVVICLLYGFYLLKNTDK